MMLLFLMSLYNQSYLVSFFLYCLTSRLRRGVSSFIYLSINMPEVFQKEQNNLIYNYSSKQFAQESINSVYMFSDQIQTNFQITPLYQSVNPQIYQIIFSKFHHEAFAFINSNLQIQYMHQQKQKNIYFGNCRTTQQIYKKTELQLQETKNNNNKSSSSKVTTITFLKIGHCHMCQNKGRLVYQCYKLYTATTCDKKYCIDCLVIIYKENIIEIVQNEDNWCCPFMKNICRCRSCCSSRKEADSVLIFDGTLSVLQALKGNQKLQEDDCGSEIDQAMKCLLKEKFKKLIQFNGVLISKLSDHLEALNQAQSQFYNKVIHSNLKVLYRLSRNMMQNDSIIDQ